MKYKPQNEIDEALKKLLRGSITMKDEKIVQAYKPIQD
jgi:hypothetical protein